MKRDNILVSIGMILMAAALMLEHYKSVNDTIFGIMMGVAIGLGILNLIIPCITKKN